MVVDILKAAFWLIFCGTAVAAAFIGLRKRRNAGYLLAAISGLLLLSWEVPSAIVRSAYVERQMMTMYGGPFIRACYYIGRFMTRADLVVVPLIAALFLAGFFLIILKKDKVGLD